MEIRLVTGNRFKADEAAEILKGSNVKILQYNFKIEELQTIDVNKLVEDKLLKAFNRLGRPLIVEHTGLYIRYLNDFPGGLTQIFWDSLQADKFAEIIGNLPDTHVVAKTMIGYCDSRKNHYFGGEIEGKVSSVPKGNRDFQWDCVFIPNGETQTFAEMGDKKNLISMRKIAYDTFKRYIESL